MLEIVPDIAQSTHGIRNIFADIRNVPTRPHMVLGMFLLLFPVDPKLVRRYRKMLEPFIRPINGSVTLGDAKTTHSVSEVLPSSSALWTMTWKSIEV